MKQKLDKLVDENALLRAQLAVWKTETKHLRFRADLWDGARRVLLDLLLLADLSVPAEHLPDIRAMAATARELLNREAP